MCFIEQNAFSTDVNMICLKHNLNWHCYIQNTVLLIVTDIWQEIITIILNAKATFVGVIDGMVFWLHATVNNRQ